MSPVFYSCLNGFHFDICTHAYNVLPSYSPPITLFSLCPFIFISLSFFFNVHKGLCQLGPLMVLCILLLSMCHVLIHTETTMSSKEGHSTVRTHCHHLPLPSCDCHKGCTYVIRLVPSYWRGSSSSAKSSGSLVQVTRAGRHRALPNTSPHRKLYTHRFLPTNAYNHHP